MCPKFRSLRGFTLVELLVALMITAILLTAFVGTLRAGITAYNKTEVLATEIFQSRALFMILEHELRDAIIYSETPFSGEATRLSFPALIDEYDEETATKVPALITYEYREKTLYRRQAPLRDLFSEEKESSKKILVLNSFTVQYAYREREGAEIIWKSYWRNDLGVPRGVKITLSFETKSKDKKTAKTAPFVVTKKIFIPQGKWGWAAKALS